MRRPDVASIRPRLQARGNNFEAFVTRDANDWLQFGRGCKPAETRQVNPFPAHITSLQFGRGCKPAETGRGRGVRHARGRASIRPRLQARGNLFPTPYGSLEANASIRPRLQARGNVEPVAIHSSPLELQFGRGCKPAETSRRMTSRSTRRVLQFGRGCKPAETGLVVVRGKCRPVASIRPRLQARGNDDQVDAAVMAYRASIRPRLQARGNRGCVLVCCWRG